MKVNSKLAIASLVVSVALMAGTVYVAVHFIAKYW